MFPGKRTPLVWFFLNLLLLQNVTSDFDLKALSAMNGFGPYVVSTRQVAICEPSEAKDEAAYLTFDVHAHKVSRSKEKLSGFLQVPKESTIRQAKLIAEIWRDGKFKQIFSKVIPKPCDNIIVLKLLEFSVTAFQKCLTKVGNHTVASLADINELIHLMVGDKFFYERVAVNVELDTANGAIICARVVCEISMLRKKKKN